MARLFLFIPFPVETWRAASLCIKYIINQCMCALRNINHSFIINIYIETWHAYIYYQSMHMCVTILNIHIYIIKHSHI